MAYEITHLDTRQHAVVSWLAYWRCGLLARVPHAALFRSERYKLRDGWYFEAERASLPPWPEQV